MRVVAIKNPGSDAEKYPVHEMHRMRARIIRGWLAWDTRCTSRIEDDRFDELEPACIAHLVSAADGTMLRDVFPQRLATRHRPTQDRMIESFRFCVDTDNTTGRKQGGLYRATGAMLRYRQVELPQWSGNRHRNGRKAPAHPASGRLAYVPPRIIHLDQRHAKRCRHFYRRQAEFRSASPQPVFKYHNRPEGGCLTMLGTQNRSLPRLVSKLQNALGDHLCVALDDPSVVEIMLNPDGRLFIERLGQGIAAAGEMSRSAAETVIGSVAHVLSSEIDDERPIVSGELPIGGHRFEGLLPPVVSGPSFTIRRRASRLIPLDDYVASRTMTISQADVIRSAVASKLNLLVAGGTAERSGIIDVLKESCPTKICLPNGAAGEPGTREFYERIGFNERQIEIVSAAIPKREYYVASPEGRRLFDMSLGPLALSFVGASGKEDLRHIRALKSEHGRSWPVHWLETRGVHDATSLLNFE